MPVTPGRRGHRDRDPGWGVSGAHRPGRRKWKSTFQTFGKEVCLTGHSLCPSMQTILKECVCCECHIKFGGHLPVPRAEAALPYWVPPSLRPRKQIPKMAQLCVPRAVRTCPCPCHSFGGRLPAPRVQAVMPYWVPRGLRSRNKVVKRQWSFKGMKERRLLESSLHKRWRICGDRRLLLKWQHLQALHQEKPLALRRTASPPAPPPPLSLSFLTFLQAILRALVAIRQLFWV
ncbi:uncharacterized protein [Dipodomys merriami]|uniref:uncharacterized protein isoform X1 n=1 Tax=Dipodomys merriami TaxID=94247 RepID=UPI00384DA120